MLEGDTLVGCRQNRMVAWSVLVAARSVAPVSVGCMERGRWSTGGRHFLAGEMTVDPHLRRRTKRETNATAASHGGPRLDQGRAWSDIDAKLGEWRVFSASADYHSGLASRVESSRRQVRELQPVPGQVGVVALHGDRLLGLEVVGHPDTWRALAGRVLPSYVLGAESARRDPEFQRVPRLPDAGGLARGTRGVAGGDSAARPGRVRSGAGGNTVSGSCRWKEARPGTWRCSPDEAGEYRMLESEGHILVELEDGLALIDTGSPTTLRGTQWLSRFLSVPVVELLGTDGRAHPFLVDRTGKRIAFGAEPPDVPPVRLRPLLGVSVFELGHGGARCEAVLDTGAQLSYAPPSAVAGGHSPERRTDFMPAIGCFEVSTAIVDVEIGGVSAELRVGVLPPLAQAALGMAGIPEWIVGSEFLRNRRTWIDLASGQLRIATH